MQYKTIVLELLQQMPGTYQQLRKEQMLLPTLQRFAGKLKNLHEAWKELLTQSRPGSDPSQIASEALEFALKEVEELLVSGAPPTQDDPLSLEQAIAFLRRRTPPV